LRILRRFSPTVLLSALLASALSVLRTNAALQLEILALRHQLGVLLRWVKKPKLMPFERLLWTWLCDDWSGWHSAHESVTQRVEACASSRPTTLPRRHRIEPGITSGF
jgi:hypothetical protein